MNYTFMIYKDTIEQELDRNRRYISSKKIRDSLEAFAMDLKVKDSLTDHRVMFYLIRLRVLSHMESEEEFLYCPGADCTLCRKLHDYRFKASNCGIEELFFTLHTAEDP